MLSKAIYNILSSVSSNIYPGVGEQEINAPFIVHNKVRTGPTPDKDGASKNDFIFYRIACYAEDIQDVQTLADSVRTALDEYEGVTGGIDILRARFDNEENGFDEESNFFFVMQTYRIMIRLIT